MSKRIIAVMVMLVAVGVVVGVAAAQGPPGDAGPPDNVTTGPPGDAGPPDNVTTGPPDNVTTGPPEGVAEFLSTSPLGPGQVDPNSLSGNMRVESEHAANTTVELTNNNETETSLDVTVTGNATNVTFYVQKQAVEAAHDIENVTVAVDGEGVDFGVADHAGGNWIGFEVDHFSTRTVTISSEGAGAGDGAPDDPADVVDDYDEDGSGAIDTSELQNGISAFLDGDIGTGELQALVRNFASNAGA